MHRIIYVTPAGRAAFTPKSAILAREVEAQSVSLPDPLWKKDIPDGWPPPTTAAPAPAGVWSNA